MQLFTKAPPLWLTAHWRNAANLCHPPNCGQELTGVTGPRMAEKLLLHIEYEALLHNRPIPWDAVAHRFSKSTRETMLMG